MNATELITHYADYDQWANTRLVERLMREPDAVLDAPVKSSFPSIRNTLMHIRNAEHVWLQRLLGLRHNWPAEADSSLAMLLKHNELLVTHVRSLDGPALDRICTYNDLRGNAHEQPVWQMLMHCFNHSSYHRGQVITMMRALDLSDVPATDLIVYQRSLLRKS